jgi:DNA-binding Xre family transcriptional regulator
MALYYKLGNVLGELEITKNALAVEAKVRPATVTTYVNGDVGRIEIDTLTNMLDAINRMAIEKGITRRYGLEDIISYEYKGAE